MTKILKLFTLAFTLQLCFLTNFSHANIQTFTISATIPHIIGVNYFPESDSSTSTLKKALNAPEKYLTRKLTQEIWLDSRRIILVTIIIDEENDQS